MGISRRGRVGVVERVQNVNGGLSILCLDQRTLYQLFYSHLFTFLLSMLDSFSPQQLLVTFPVSEQLLEWWQNIHLDEEHRQVIIVEESATCAPTKAFKIESLSTTRLLRSS